MKLVSLIIVISLSFSLSSSVTGQLAKDLLTGFFQTVKAGTFVLPDTCFGTDFESKFARLCYAITKENALLFAAVAGEMLNDFKTTCPFSDAELIVNDAIAVAKNGTLSKNVLDHSSDLLHAIDTEVKTANYTATNLGQTFGKLIDIAIYGIVPANSLNFLQVETSIFQMFTREDVKLFVDGFFEGVSSVPYDENECKDDISSVKGEIVEAFTALIQAIKTRTNIIDALMKVYALTSTLKDMTSSCNFPALSYDLLALASKVGIAKVIYRVTTNFRTVVSNIRTAYTGYANGDLRASGVAFGTIVKISLNWSTI